MEVNRLFHAACSWLDRTEPLIGEFNPQRLAADHHPFSEVTFK